MRFGIGFDGRKLIAEIFCGLLLVFSFIGEKELGSFYGAFLICNIAIVMVSLFFAILVKIYEK